MTTATATATATATKKKTGKKAAKKVASKEVALAPLAEGNLSTNALAAIANYNPAHFEGVDLDITDNKELFTNDIVVPKIWLLQTMSELSKDRDKKDLGDGDYVNSRTEEVLLSVNGKQEFLPIIVIKTFKRWQTFKILDDGKKEFVSSEMMVLGKNENLAYKFTAEGSEHTRRQVISAYVLLGEDAQKGLVKPYIIDFASTSKGGGRDLVSDIKVLNAKKLPSYVGWFKLSTVEVKKDHDYFVKVVKFGGLLPEQMMTFLKDAYTEITSMISANVIEIDDRDVHDAAKQASTNSANVVDAASDDAGI